MCFYIHRLLAKSGTNRIDGQAGKNRRKPPAVGGLAGIVVRGQWTGVRDRKQQLDTTAALPHTL